MDSSQVRESSHAGSWYLGDSNQLQSLIICRKSAWHPTWQLLLQSQKGSADLESQSNHRAVFYLIYYYFNLAMLDTDTLAQLLHGPTSTLHRLKSIPIAFETFSLRVFLLGPCHHVYLEGVGLSKLASYETPLGNIPLDRESILFILTRIYSAID
jgi:predicted class III extradiol MEMO1 family dioxygenase